MFKLNLIMRVVNLLLLIKIMFDFLVDFIVFLLKLEVVIKIFFLVI